MLRIVMTRVRLPMYSFLNMMTAYDDDYVLILTVAEILVARATLWLLDDAFQTLKTRAGRFYLAIYIGQSHITWTICFFPSPEYGLCEQQCSTYFGRVICTCFAGYNFNKVMMYQFSHPVTHPAFGISHPVSNRICTDIFRPV